MSVTNKLAWWLWSLSAYSFHSLYGTESSPYLWLPRLTVSLGHLVLPTFLGLLYDTHLSTYEVIAQPLPASRCIALACPSPARPYYGASPTSLITKHIPDTISLTSLTARTRITKPPQDQSVIKGTQASMVCGVTHDPRVTVRYSTQRGRGHL